MNKYLYLFCIFILFLSTGLDAGENAHPRLLIKLPTRQRPQQLFQVLDLYYEKLSNQIPYQFVISCDNDDLTMNNPEVWAKLETYPNLTVHYGDNKSKIEACNADIDKHPDFDILLLASDDMYPFMDQYDLILVEAMQKHFPDYDGLVQFNDGNGVVDGLITYPIMGKKYYDRFGYIYYPEYKSFFCDNEMTYVSYMLNRKAWIKQVLLEHRHYYFQKAEYDELYITNNKHWRHDELLFYKRMAQNFDLLPAMIVFPIHSTSWDAFQLFPSWRMGV